MVLTWCRVKLVNSFKFKLLASTRDQRTYRRRLYFLWRDIAVWSYYLTSPVAAGGVGGSWVDMLVAVVVTEWLHGIASGDTGGWHWHGGAATGARRRRQLSVTERSDGVTSRRPGRQSWRRQDPRAPRRWHRPTDARTLSLVCRLSVKSLSSRVNGNMLNATFFCSFINSFMGTVNYSSTSNNVKLVHWPLMGGLLYFVQREGAWAGCGPAPPRPLLAVPNITGHTHQRPVYELLYCWIMVRCCAVLMYPLKG